MGASAERVALVNVLARFQSDGPTSLLRAVVKGDDELSAEAAALGLARRWDDEALIPLIRMLKNGHNTRAAVRHLQLLTSQAFESESYAEQAKNYQGWATAHATGNACLVGTLQQQAAERAQLGLEEAMRVLELDTLEGIGADQFGEPVGLVRRGGNHGAHLVQLDLDATPGEGPGCFAARESPADHRYLHVAAAFLLRPPLPPRRRPPPRIEARRAASSSIASGSVRSAGSLPLGTLALTSPCFT